MNIANTSFINNKAYNTSNLEKSGEGGGMYFECDFTFNCKI